MKNLKGKQSGKFVPNGLFDLSLLNGGDTTCMQHGGRIVKPKCDLGDSNSGIKLSLLLLLISIYVLFSA